MKKSFRNLLFGAAALSMALAVGAGLGLADKKEVKPVEAASAGSLIVKLGNVGKWSQSNAKLAAYLTDDSSNYWSTLQTISSDKVLYKIDYSISFTPKKLIFVRMNPAATSGNWEQKWNQTGDLSWKEATYLQDEWDPTTAQCSQWTVSAMVRSSEVEGFGTKTTLSNIGINDSGNPEVSGSVTLIEGEEFKILSGDGVWSGYYGRPDALANAISGGSTESRSDENPNIVCEIAGTYDFYFDTETKRLWISRQDIVDADGWASYFLNNVGCDETGVKLPTGWDSCKTAYNALTNEAKNYIYAGTADEDGDNLGRALARYDHAVSSHASLERFIKNSGGTVRAASVQVSPLFGTDGNNASTILIIISVSSLVALTVGGYFLLKKKRA